MEKQIHPILKQLINEKRAFIDKYKEKESYEGEVAEKQWMIKEMKGLWTKYSDTPLIIQMTKLVEKKVKRYFTDFFLHDLQIIDKREKGRFAWFVGDCGTHLVWLDNESEIENQRKLFSLEAINRYYSHYDLFIGDTTHMTLKRTKYENVEEILKHGMELRNYA